MKISVSITFLWLCDFLSYQILTNIALYLFSGSRNLPQHDIAIFLTRHTHISIHSRGCFVTISLKNIRGGAFGEQCDQVTDFSILDSGHLRAWRKK